MSQNYGVLRVVRVRASVNDKHAQGKYPTGWLPENRLVHLLTRNGTTIGRALTNDVILMDPTVSREHARLLYDEQGWYICNLTRGNIVRVNGRAVPGGGCLPIQPQDYLVLGSTILQLIAPQTEDTTSDADGEEPTQRLSLQKGGRPSSALPLQWQRETPLHDQVVELSPTSTSASEQPAAFKGKPSRYQQFTASSFNVPEARMPQQPEAEQQAQPWEEGEENLLGAGITMQFALPQRMGTRTRWLIASIGIAIVLVSAVITIVLNSFIGISALVQNGSSSLLAALTIPLIPALVINLLVNFIDRFEREPWFLRIAAFLWGAIIAIPPASFIEQQINLLITNWLGPDGNYLLRSVFQGLNAGITEETVKGLGLLLLFLVLRDEFDNVTDGIVYGALIGAGFAMVENFVYFAFNSKDFLLILIVGRIVLGWLCHSTFTVCLGAALGYVRHTRVRWRQIVIPLLGYLIAVGLHTVFDFVTIFANELVVASPGNQTVALFSLIAVVCNYIPPFAAQLVLLYILIKALAHESAVIREFLASEVADGVVRVEEYALLQNSFQRTKQEREVLRRSGWKQWMRVQALYQTEIGLAFRKWHVSMGDKPKLGYRQPEDAYRQRIRRLRCEIVEAGGLSANVVASKSAAPL